MRCYSYAGENAMEDCKKRLSVDFSTLTSPIVSFEGDYMTKKELDFVLRAIKKKHKVIIREYRRNKIIEEFKLKEKKVEVSNNVHEERSESKGNAAAADTVGQLKPTTAVSNIEPVKPASGNDKKHAGTAAVASGTVISKATATSK